MEWITALAVGSLFGIGIFLILRRNLIRSAIGLFVLANAINLFLLSTGAFQGVLPAYYGVTGGVREDALPQALLLTAIVISMGGVSFVLALLLTISARYKTSDSDNIDRLSR